MLRMLVAPVALMLAVPAMAQDADASKAAIGAAMHDSAAGWDAGDVDRFLAIYSDDPATSFTGSKGVERGKANIRARYMVTYAKQFAGMASAPPTRLSFTFQDFRMIGADHALLIAQWKLVTFGDEKGAQTGMTSLLFRKETGGWKIIADHSS
jgi:uncharacterized protein (TIGR02246 family)